MRAPGFVDYLRLADFSSPLQLASPDGRRTLSLQVVSFGDEERLLLSQDVTDAARVEAMRRDFVANVSHELRTPMHAVLSFARLGLQRTAGGDGNNAKLALPLSRLEMRWLNQMKSLNSFYWLPLGLFKLKMKSNQN